MFLLSEYPGETRTDPLNERSILRRDKAEGHMHAIGVLQLRQIRAFDLRDDTQLGNKRVLEKTFGLSVLLADEANDILDMDLSLPPALSPEH